MCSAARNRDRRLPFAFIRSRLQCGLLINPQLTAGEAYTNGTLTIEEGTLYDFLTIAGMNFNRIVNAPMSWLTKAGLYLVRRVHQFNPVSRARANAAHHYDLSDRLYELFLDPDRQYSCAYFENPDDTLEQAQENKKRLIADKLLLAPGQHVLDIGCGWGGLALSLAQREDIHVNGVTLAENQHRIANRRAREMGLTERVRFALRDYRHLKERYDRIVSIGMFEHVGVTHYQTFFETLRERLKEDGVALLHTIGRSSPPGTTDPWIRKYIFPGGYIPALSEVLAPIEKSGLVVTDIEILRLHYAETLRRWRMRFQANRAAIRDIYDERFCRMWEYYLTGSEIAFRHMGLVVFQIQLGRKQEAVPLTRDYLHGDSRRRNGRKAA